MSSQRNETKTDDKYGDGVVGDGNKGNFRRRLKFTERKIADDEFMAASIGDMEWLKQSIRDKKEGLNFDKNGLTPLHLAAIHGRLDCLKFLIEKHKVDVNLPSTTGWRPVHLAISNQTGKRALQCLQYLLEKGADPSITNDDGITPCHQAASEGHVQCLKLLIEVGSKVNGKDSRGHSPLDLAKLWGHRKCARILSAEVWHQEKDHVAKEMKQLKRLKMQQVLNQLDEEEQHKAAQEFYGDIAFKDWLDKRNLEQKPTGPSGNSVKEKMKGQSPGKESLYKANSMKKEETGGKTTSQIKVSRRQDTFPVHSVDRQQVDSAEKDQVDSGTEGVPQNEGRSQSSKPVYINPKGWVKSTKVPESSYTVNLGDDYPRDEYTRMPVTDDAPKYYDGSFWRKIETPKHEVEKLRGKKLRNPDLPGEMVQRVLSQDHSRDQRPFIFKPVHIYDVNAKRKHPEDKVPRSEAYLHMCDDISSFLFQRSLVKGEDNSVSRRSSRSSKSLGSDYSGSEVSRVRLVKALENMSQPNRFPPIRGEE